MSEEMSPTMPDDPSKGPEFGSNYTTNGNIELFGGGMITSGAEVTYLGSFVSPIDRQAGQEIGDLEFGVWNVYQTELEEGKKGRIHTVPNSEADLKARGLWAEDSDPIPTVHVSSDDYEAITKLSEDYVYHRVLQTGEGEDSLQKLIDFAEDKPYKRYINHISHHALIAQGLAFIDPKRGFTINEEAVREKYSFDNLFQ